MRTEIIDGIPHIGIGALSCRTGCSIDTIRYYERIGLMPKVPRNGGSQRLYGREHQRRLAFIRSVRQLGLSLPQVRGMLDRIDRNSCHCSDVRSMLVQQADDVRKRLAELRRLDRSLRSLIEICGNAGAVNCRVIESMLAGEQANSKRAGCG